MKESVTDVVKSKIESYIEKNYKNHGKVVKIIEGESSYLVYKHIDGGPLYLNKSIVD